MLNPAALASKIVSALQNQDNANTAMQKLGQAIAEYLCDNTTIVYSWVGIMPGTPPTPDPVVVCQSTRLMGTFVCTPTNATTAVQHGIQLGEQIRSGIGQLKAVPPTGFTIPPATFANAAPILLMPTQAKSGFQHWLQWSSTIITTFMTYINPTPLPGAHASYIGSPGAIMTTIF